MGMSFTDSDSGNPIDLTTPSGIPNIPNVTEIQVTNGSLTTLAPTIGLVDTTGLFSENTLLRNIIGGAGTVDPTGTDNFLAGDFAGSSLTTGGSNIGIGTNVLRLGTGAPCQENTVVGVGAMENTISSNNNVAIGTDACSVATQSRGGVYIGSHAGENLTTPRDTIAIGLQALGGGGGANLQSIAIGTRASFNDAIVTEGNISIGFENLLNNVNRLSVISIGNETCTNLNAGANGNGVIALGMNALSGVADAEGVVCIGNSTSGGSNPQADNVIIGIQAGETANLNDAVVIGSHAFGGSGADVGGQRAIIIGKDCVNQPLASGIGGNDCIMIGTNLLLPTATTSRYISIGDVFRAQINTNDVFLSCPSNDPTALPMDNNECSFFVSGGIFQVRYTDNAGVSTTFNLS